jgi:hypothetical protein
MLRAVTVTTLATLGAFGALIGIQAATANGQRSGLFAGEYHSVVLGKTSRIAVAGQGKVIPLDEAANVEWVIDCYDQYGPDAETPDAGALERCIPS